MRMDSAWIDKSLSRSILCAIIAVILGENAKSFIGINSEIIDCTVFHEPYLLVLIPIRNCLGRHLLGLKFPYWLL